MHIPSLKEVVSAEEWALRVDLAAAYRLVALYGWSDLVFTHISARLPGPGERFLINPYGLMFDEITASSLVVIDHEGRKIGDSPFPVNPVSPEPSSTFSSSVTCPAVPVLTVAVSE